MDNCRRIAGGAIGVNESGEESEKEVKYVDLLSYALIVLKIQRDDFDWLTPKEFQSCIKLHNDRQELEIKGQFELERFNSWLNLAPHIKGRSQEELLRFPWETIKKGRVLNGGSNAISKT